MTTVAGDGTAGFVDNVAASKARFKVPVGIALDSAGTIYVADRDNQRIRMIKSEKVTTYAGSGKKGYADGTTVAAKFEDPYDLQMVAGTLYVADKGNHCIRMIKNGTVDTFAGMCGTPGYLDGPAKSAKFKSPYSLNMVSGVMYVADTSNHCIRTISNGKVGTLTGECGTPGKSNGILSKAGFNHPKGVAVDENGRIFVAEPDRFRIRAILP